MTREVDHGLRSPESAAERDPGPFSGLVVAIGSRFPECSILASNIYHKAGERFASGKVYEMNLSVLRPGGEVQFSDKELTTLGCIEADGQTRPMHFVLGRDPGDSETMELYALVRNTVAVPLVRFGRKNGSCDYIQLGDDIYTLDDDIVATPKDEKTRRRELEAIQQLLSATAQTDPSSKKREAFYHNNHKVSAEDVARYWEKHDEDNLGVKLIGLMRDYVTAANDKRILRPTESYEMIVSFMQYVALFEALDGPGLLKLPEEQLAIYNRLKEKFLDTKQDLYEYYQGQLRRVPENLDVAMNELQKGYIPYRSERLVKELILMHFGEKDPKLFTGSDKKTIREMLEDGDFKPPATYFAEVVEADRIVDEKLGLYNPVVEDLVACAKVFVDPKTPGAKDQTRLQVPLKADDASTVDVLIEISRLEGKRTRVQVFTGLIGGDIKDMAPVAAYDMIVDPTSKLLFGSHQETQLANITELVALLKMRHHENTIAVLPEEQPKARASSGLKGFLKFIVFPK